MKLIAIETVKTYLYDNESEFDKHRKQMWAEHWKCDSYVKGNEFIKNDTTINVRYSRYDYHINIEKFDKEQVESV